MDNYKFSVDDIAQAMPWIITGGAGILGRLMYHACQVQRGVRKPWSWTLLWDVPIALGMGWIALGMAIWSKTQWEVTISISLVTSYLGPHALDVLFSKWAEWSFKEKSDGSKSE